MKSISDFDISGTQLDGEKVQKENIMGKEIEIHNFVELTSEADPNQTYLIIQGKLKGKFITFTSGTALMNQLKRVGKENLPIKATITTKKGKYNRDYYLFE